MPFLNTRDGRIYYEVHNLTPPWVGVPETVLFHHGIAANLHHWNDWFPHFCVSNRIVVFDARGCGLSSVPGPGFDWSLEQLAGDVLDVAQAAGANRFHFVGDSVGGMVGLHMAARMPDRLLSLTAANCVARGRELREIGSWPALLDQQGKSGWAKQLMAWRYPPGSLPVPQRDWLAHQLENCPLPVVLSLAHVMLHADITPALGRIAVPTLLLCSEAAPFVPHTHMAEMRALIPAAELQHYAAALDGLIISHAQACALAVRTFHLRRAATHRFDFPHVV
jgi:3-oxoadipate enol-lactonase